jgi:hypothetical protein
MYGLPQAGILENELLQPRLTQDGYRPPIHPHGLWIHDTRPITFSLVVGDFGTKYVRQEHAEHLKASIKKHYQISCDWTASAYCGIQLDWDYKYRCVDLPMPGCIKAAPHKFQHPPPTRPEIHHTHGARPYMSPKNSTLRSKKTALCSLKRMSHAFDSYLACYYIM